jgi:Mce-associated membrane protein
MAVDADPADRELAAAPTEESPNEPGESDEPAEADSDAGTSRAAPGTRLRRAIAASLAITLTVGGLTGWLGYRAYESRQHQLRHNMFLQTARQGALNLTTISYTEVEADVQRIIGSATGTFHDDFQKRSQPFVDVVKQAQSKSQGSITEAAVESENRDSAQVLLAVTVDTSIAGVAEPQPRAWRMRINVEQVGDSAKIANVEFVP